MSGSPENQHFSVAPAGRGERRRAVLVAALVFFGYGYFFNHYDKISNPNETSRLYLTLAVVDSGTLAINDAIARHGVTWDRAERNGKLYCDKAPGIAFLAVPFYAAAKGVAALFGYELTMDGIQLAARFGTVILPTVVLCFFLYLFLAPILPSPRLRAGLVVLYALATPARIYGTLFFGHQTAAVLSIGGVILLLAQGRAAGWRAALCVFGAGVLVGGAFTVEYPALVTAILAGVLALFVVRPWWRLPIAALGVAVPVGLCLWYNQVAFGNPFSPGYAHLDSTFAAIHAKGLFGITTPKPEALYGVFLSFGRGLFVYAPWLVAALPGLFYLFPRGPSGQRALWVGVVLALLGYTYFATSFGFWIGGDAAGPRHLTALLPFLVFPAAAFVNRLAASRWQAPRILLSAAFVYSLVLSSFVAATFSYFSPDFANPFRDVTLEFWREGALAPNLGHLLGLRGAWSALPYLVVMGALAVRTACAYWWGAAREGSTEEASGRVLRFAAPACVLAVAALALAVVVAAFPSGRDVRGAHEARRYMKDLRPPGPLYEEAAADTARGRLLRGNAEMMDNQLDAAIQSYRASGPKQ